MKCPKCLADNPPDSRFCRKCATPLPVEEDLAISQTKTLQMPATMLDRGTTFAERYEIIEELGKGGMGRVYKAFDKKIKEVVALKLIRPEISADRNTIERFNNELRLARKISHRHVCRMYDVGQEGPSHFITMEYVPGEDLKRFIKRSGQLTVGKAVSIAKQVCDGLAEAHHLGIVHRDLKPQNIMIDENGNTRIMDFGIARFLEGEGMTTQGVMIGTPDYMAPEQAELEGVDQRSDIYALGIILFEMVTGRVPFMGKTPLSVAMKHKNQDPPDPTDLNAQVTADLSRVILMCLEKEKSQRYQIVEDLLADLKNIEEGLPTTQKIIPKAKSQPSDEITVTFKKKKFLIPALVVLAIFVAFVIRQIIPPGETVTTVQETSNLVKPPVPPEIRAGREDRASEKTTPSLRSLIPTDIEKVIDPSKFSGEIQWLGRALSMISPEAMKNIDEEELKGFEKFLVTIRDKLPEEGSYRSAIDQVRSKLKEGKKLQDAGKQEEAEESYLESQSQMRNLLESVRQKERADRAKNSMEQARLYASQRVSAAKDNLLFAVAEEQVKLAADSYDKGDFAGANTLYGVLEKIFTYSVQESDGAGSVEILKNYVAGLRTEVNIAGIPASASWFYDRAREEEEQGKSLSEEKEYEAAVETYIQAAFLYEKVQEEVAKNRIPQRR
ncbi:MAG: protein kinase [Candidatus Aminicenantes bacterium]|nr:MAG: protein kinase [Candidatus Aminicenantes bacterium]